MFRAQELCEQGGQDRERVARGDSRPLVAVRCSELRSCVKKGGGPGSHSLSHSFPVPE